MPLGTSLLDLVAMAGGGTGSTKAVFVGGPGGGAIDVGSLTLAYDYEPMEAAGAVIGSGSVLVTDSATCMVDSARFFVDFSASEACGKAVPCRIGTRRLVEGLDRILAATPRPNDFIMLRELSRKMSDTALCKLERLAPNPILTTLERFGDEYRAHAERGVCLAGACRRRRCPRPRAALRHRAGRARVGTDELRHDERPHGRQRQRNRRRGGHRLHPDLADGARHAEDQRHDQWAAGRGRGGPTILQACRVLGIEIPTLCYEPKLAPYGACRICAVEVEGRDDTPISCGTTITEGMVITTHSDRIIENRRMVLELIFSDHDAYCLPPCQFKCPTRVDIPGYLKQNTLGNWEEATRILKRSLPFPAILGRVCPAPCETHCRREEVDTAIAIRDSHRYCADRVLEVDAPRRSRGRRSRTPGGRWRSSAPARPG